MQEKGFSKFNQNNLKLPVYVPCVDLMRDDVVDQRFFGIVSLFNSKGEILDYAKTADGLKIGCENKYPFFLRSLLKPIQASIMADFNTQDFYNFSNPEIAIMQASHSGEKIHTDLVLSILKKANLDESYLKCPVIQPLSPFAIIKNERLQKIHNNCSAKHAMMLAISKQLNFSLDDYTSINHPLQKIILKKVIELSEYENPPSGFDGCTLPVWALPFENIQKAFFKLYNDTKYEFLKTSYMENPYIIGGRDNSGLRQDTLIMKLNPNLISKTGAGGFLSIYNNETKEFLLIKMAQDNNKARIVLTLSILSKLGWIKNDASWPDFNFYDENNMPVGIFKALI